MTKTRKRAREESAQDAAEAGSQNAEAATAGWLQVPVPDDIDHEYLSELLPNIPDLSRVTPDAVAALYKLVVGLNTDLDGLRREVEELHAEGERKDVELDQALQDKESIAKEFEESMENVHAELESVKREKERLAEENAELKAKVSALSNSQTSASSEVEGLKHQVDDVEREKRELLGVITRMREEGAQREDEIQTLRANLKEARQEHQALESQVRELKSSETSTKFKVDTLQQQLQLAQAEAERASGELTSKAEEYAKYRRTKHAEMLQLQSAHDTLQQELTSTSASLKALQSVHKSQSDQLSQALSKVQALTSQVAEQESKYASEANNLRRLIGMMEERETQAKEIVENIEHEWATVGEKAERREQVLKQEIERERRGREEAEKRVDNLETVIRRMGHGDLPIPGTPFRTPGGVASLEGMMGISPTVALASKSQKGGKTFTEVYADYVRLQEEHAAKCLEHEQMERTLTHVLAEIEERAPILTQQRAEYDRVKDEAAQLSSQLSVALSEREALSQNSQDQAQKIKAMNSENNLLEKQLTDLGRQVQNLLREIARRDDPTIPSDDDLMNEPAAPATDVDEVITSHLVLFRNIENLQEQNQRLLKVTRELGAKMESEEREYKETMQAEQAEAIREAHEAMQELAQQLEDQKRNSDGLIQSYVKERDALKSMLARTNGNAGRNGVHAIAPANGAAPVLPDSEVAKELAEVQSQFEVYRMEMGVDTGRVREELTATQREAHKLSAELAKANSRIEYLNDRHKMHQDQFLINNRDLEELTKRNQQLFDQWTRVDVECQRVTEELHVSNGRLEQLRNECANLRAEKNIWESVQARLVEENRALGVERSHLASLMTNIQRMHGDLERSGENDRRRLEGQLQMLESQNQDLRTQLSRERDALRHVSLQKELEAKELQGRLDKANEEVSRTREALVGAETSKKHLEDRLADLTKQLQGNQEKLGVYERRPATMTAGGDAAAASDTSDLSREQQLEQEVAELRGSLKVAEVDLAAARRHVEQFKDISQANEAALSSLSATFDEYKASTENQLAHRESEYKALEEKLESANAELAQIREQHATLSKSFEEERNAWKSDKKTLEDTIFAMTTSEKDLESDRSSREHEIRAIEERAKAAEERYSNEVLAHAETIKNIEQLKQQLAEWQRKARESQSAAETAQAKLAASEGSWKAQKEALDKEVSDLNTRCQDLASQNAILHQHLESVSSQASRIRVAAEGSAAAATGESDSDDADTKLTELRSVVSYLRKEKEIVDLQLELGKQENARLKAQIDHLTQSLQEARDNLSEERERAVESAASAAQHAELVERINQLNILRESNATLRADCENHAKKSRELEIKLRTLNAELEPTKEQARTAQAELEVCRGKIQRLEQESQSWQDRNRQLLSKYDRVDPAELQALKDELAKTKERAEQAEKKIAELEAELAKKDAELAEMNAKFTRLESVHTNLKKKVDTINASWRDRVAKQTAAKAEWDSEKAVLEGKVAELEKAAAAAAAAPAPEGQAAAPDPAVMEQVKRQAVQISALQAEKKKLLEEKEALSQSVSAQAAAAPGEAPANWEAEKSELVKARDEALEKLKAATEQVQKEAAQARDIRMQNEKFQSRLASLNKTKATEQERIDAAVSDAVAKITAEGSGAPGASSEEVVKKHAEEMENLKKELIAKHEAELKAAVEQARQAASAQSGSSQSDVQAAVEAVKKELEEKHAKEIEEARDSGRLESNSKIKVKDGQLTKALKKNKDLEVKIREWEEAGLLPANSLATATSAGSVPATSSTASVPAQARPAAPIPAKPAAAGAPAPAKAPAPAPGPSRPTGVATRGGAGAMSGGVGLGRGGVPAARGRGAVRGAIRGGARALPTRTTPPVNAGGIAIVGAAAAAAASSAPKRPREEGEAGTADDSLAKRLKPAADGAAASGSTPPAKPPIQIRRQAPGP
ncbi:hypothetical protein D9611_007504 [Ephemerocybe angulata]|uniref:Nucleoprotein TPR/MLP1 domain-containing protein n=1 Tax=Ephemerocybe angulata TaxID=980116 RepID=A0A8H5CFH7_9AGAR|nr:hypothetical protein D9611_007504 [Tulosesus angulatus]